MTHPLVGAWRIVAMELWDQAFVDLLGPGTIAFDDHGCGEFRFGAVNGGLDCSYAERSIAFTWSGYDEMDEASGDGWAELEDDGAIEGEIAFHRGDTSTFRAVRLNSSTAC
jgi:hypothetical protein